jgi:hypothetical protein
LIPALNWSEYAAPLASAVFGTMVMVAPVTVTVRTIFAVSYPCVILTVDGVMVVAFTATLNTAVIVGAVGTFVGGVAALRSILPAFSVERLKVVVVSVLLFLQLETPTTSITARSNALRINICFFMTSFIFKV